MSGLKFDLLMAKILTYGLLLLLIFASIKQQDTVIYWTIYVTLIISLMSLIYYKNKLNKLEPKEGQKMKRLSMSASMKLYKKNHTPDEYKKLKSSLILNMFLIIPAMTYIAVTVPITIIGIIFYAVYSMLYEKSIHLLYLESGIVKQDKGESK